MSSRISSAMYGALAATALFAGLFSSAQAADLIAPGPYSTATDSDCADPRRLASIERDFSVQAREVHKQPGLQIVSITNIRENRHLPVDKVISSVDRLYCKASAGMSDGK